MAVMADPLPSNSTVTIALSVHSLRSLARIIFILEPLRALTEVHRRPLNEDEREHTTYLK